MDSGFKEEILNKFPESKLLFDSNNDEMPHFITLLQKSGGEYGLPKSYCPELAFYDKENVYCMIMINLETIPEELPYLIHIYPLELHKSLPPEELESILQKEHGESTSRCLINLLFKSYAQFNNFHWSKYNAKRPGNRLLQCLLACSPEHIETVESSLKALDLEYKKIKTKKHFAYLIDGYSFCWDINSMKRKIASDNAAKMKDDSNSFNTYITVPFEVLNAK